MLQCRIIDLWIVRKRDERGVVIDFKWRECDVRPFRDHFHIGKALDRGEGRPRVHDRDIVAEQLPNRSKSLTDMDRARNHKPR